MEQQSPKIDKDKMRILNNIRNNVIGSHINTLLRTPFG
jgi:hypothetical protein